MFCLSSDPKLFTISGVLLIKLYFARTRFRQTNTVINRLMRMAIQSGTFATIFALGDMVTFRKAFHLGSLFTSNIILVLIPEMNLYGMFTFPIGRIYTNVSPLPRYTQCGNADNQDGDC